MEQELSPAVPALDELVLKVVHDNYPCVDSLKTAWGFSALVTGSEKTILFDTGSDGTLLLENMARLQIDPGRIDIVVLSHLHQDHTGGLTGLLQANSRVQVYLPASFPTRFKEAVRGYGATVVEIGGPQEICKDVYTTGTLGRRIKEQALAIRTQRGLVVLTGCAHPGIVQILKRIRRLHEEDILLVMGGFHLEWVTKWKVEAIIAAFRCHGVRYVAPTHCSSDKARQLFQQSYGPGCLDAGVGKRIALTDLQASLT
ncbi:MAG: MBL fold metallo-hydrolase [Phycisphaerae bacterium]|nr:MBL fold metallo-hydrolase [Phycisphaerae bacterium]